MDQDTDMEAMASALLPTIATDLDQIMATVPAATATATTAIATATAMEEAGF
ncbi:hypothetical protein J3B02_002957 [Coemansia erecta]|nr:hypothetical protein J3B02_002957 [Coemansia erecta]